MKYESLLDVNGPLSKHLSRIYCALAEGAVDEAEEIYRRFTSAAQDLAPFTHDSQEWVKISER